VHQYGSGICSVVFVVDSLTDVVARLGQVGGDAEIRGQPVGGSGSWVDYAICREGASVGSGSLRLTLVEKSHRERIASNAGSISHVIYAIEPNRLRATVASLATCLGAECSQVDIGNRDLSVPCSPSAGLELLAPDVTSQNHIAVAWREHGDGPLLVAFRVYDIDAAVARAQAFSGAAPYERISHTGRPGFADRYTVLEQAALEPFCGMRVVLTQMELIGS
jgi:hypothetical protein